VTFAGSRPAQAQSNVSVDVTVGPSRASGDRNYHSDGAAAGEFTIGFRGAERRWLTGAFTVGVSGQLAHGDECILESPTDYRCRPGHPNVAHAGALAGGEWRHSGVSLRGLAGPAVYKGMDSGGFGGQFQVDFAAGSSHVAIVAVLRAGLSYFASGESLRLGAWGVGLRFQ